MNIKRIIIAATAVAAVAAGMSAKVGEVIVTRQLTMAQRSSLPDKTIEVEVRCLVPNKKAPAGLLDAITAMMDTIASEDYQNNTFVLLLEQRPGGEVSIAMRSDDIVTMGMRDNSIYYGELEHRRYHFVVLVSKDNKQLIEQTFKRKGKVKYVEEFIFVDFKTPYYPTNVMGRWSPSAGLELQLVSINDEATDNGFDRPAHAED